MTLRARILQHVPFEGPGSIEGWLRSQAATYGVTHLYAGEPLPALEDVDLLIAMGGPMSVNDEKDYPWLIEEKQYLRLAIQQQKAVLGICLGAQLIASALKATVFRNELKEIGWFPIEGLPVSADSFAFPRELTVFHWHGETFSLPAGAVQLARSAACEQQAFQYGSRVIGLQFHLETAPATLQDMLAHDGVELVERSPFIQSKNDILSIPAEVYARNNELIAAVLTYLTRAA